MRDTLMRKPLVNSYLAMLLFLRRLLPGLDFLKKRLDVFWQRYWQQQQELEARTDPGAPVSSIRGSERAVFIEAIAECWPFTSVLDVGCGYGQNAHILTELFPRLRYVGLDSDPERVAAGQAQLRACGLSQARLVEGNALDLSAFPDNSVDLLLSSAFLLYISPQDLPKVLSEMHRVAKKAIILLEQHDESFTDRSELINEAGRPPYWIRDYLKQLQVLSDIEVKAFEIPNSRWTIEKWSELARVFRVKL